MIRFLIAAITVLIVTLSAEANIRQRNAFGGMIGGAQYHHLEERQTCSSANCPVGFACCTQYPGSCCPDGVACSMGASGGVVCAINCTSEDITCQFGGCCPPGSICDNLNLSCQNINSVVPPSILLFDWVMLIFRWYEYYDFFTDAIYSDKYLSCVIERYWSLVTIGTSGISSITQLYGTSKIPMNPLC